MDARFLAASEKHPIAEGHVFKYGTAGFRMKADLLDGVTFRVGLLAGLRSRKLGSTIGIMITASHNPSPDNGVKVVDPSGDMLEQEWEAFATQLVNAKSHHDLLQTYKDLASKLKIDLNAPGDVIYARDTRPSGRKLAGALADAFEAIDVSYRDYGILTTPQLHYLTRCVNTLGTPQAYGEATEEGYYKKFSEAFVKALRGRKVQGDLIVDCSNGVGGPKLERFLKHVPQDKTGFKVKIVNDDILRPELLNHEVRFFLSIYAPTTFRRVFFFPFFFPFTRFTNNLLLVLVWCRFCQDEAESPSFPKARPRSSLLLVRRRR